MHLWTYLVLRNGGAEALQQMVQSGDWNQDACIKAGEAVVALNATEPYQAGYRAATYNQEAAAVGNGKAAMELMGQWAPSVQRDQSSDKQGLGDDLGWFAFPAVTGGAGAPTDGVGGGNGIAVGKDAPPEAVDFLKFFSDVENGNKLNTDGVGLSTTVGTEATITDPNLQAVLGGPRCGAVHPAVPRPGDVARAGQGLQRGHDGAVRRPVRSGDACARPSPTRLRRSNVEAAAPAVAIPAGAGRPSRPARFHGPEGGG